MDEKKPPNLSVVPGGNVVPMTRPSVDRQSPDRPPGLTSESEIEIWDYICAQLAMAGMPHLTFGLAAAIVCNLYAEWITARKILEECKAKNDGSYMVKLANGYEQPHQAFYVVDKLRRQLLQWLPECCLTIPAYATAKNKLGDGGQQRDLFDDLVGHANADRANYGSR
jgi:hypothetical protein